MILLLIFGVLSAVLIAPRLACAQAPERDSTWAVLDVVATVNTAIDESADSAELRQRAVRRFAECSLMYGGLSTLTTNAETKKNYVGAQLATSEVETIIAKPLQQEKRLELENAARVSVALILRGIKAQGDKEAGPLLKSCKALNYVPEIKKALQELPPL
jgi:hypothetical protein